MPKSKILQWYEVKFMIGCKEPITMTDLILDAAEITPKFKEFVKSLGGELVLGVQISKRSGKQEGAKDSVI